LPVEILLEGDGVFNWLRGIAQESKDTHSVSRLANDLERFGIPIFMVGEDMVNRGLKQDDLISTHSKIISRQDAAMMIASHETTIAV
jgi:sulfur relay (sulfurtransferase) DsrF/TusC family protein